MNHLAGIAREATEHLTTAAKLKPVRAHTLYLLRGLCALTGDLSPVIQRSYDRRADLTSRFIKAPTRIIG
jgi:hypothetical protein